MLIYHDQNNLLIYVLHKVYCIVWTMLVYQSTVNFLTFWIFWMNCSTMTMRVKSIFQLIIFNEDLYCCSTCIRCTSNLIQINWIWFEFQRVFHLWIASEWIPLQDSNFFVKFDTIIKYSIGLFWDQNQFWFCLQG